MKGSESMPYSVVILGGGPAGLSVLVRAARLKLLPEMLGGKLGLGQSHKPKREGGHEEGACCDGGGPAPAPVAPLQVSIPPVALDHEKDARTSPPSSSNRARAGVCIIDSGDELQFGSGSLGSYLISSNTHADAFVRSITVNKPDSIPPEMCSGTVLERLANSEAGMKLTQYGKGIAPLQHIGKWLHEVGEVLKATIEKSDKVRVRPPYLLCLSVLFCFCFVLFCFVFICFHLAVAHAAPVSVPQLLTPTHDDDDDKHRARSTCRAEP